MAGKPIIITVANQKGGVGKTTTVANLAASLACKKKMVLIIDCDYQANVTSLFCGDEQMRKKELTITHAIKHDLTIDKVRIGTSTPNIDIVTANRELDDLREQLTGKPNQFRLVDFMLDCEATKNYDYILIDTHPSLDCFFQSAAAASNYFLIPLFPEADSSRGLAHQLMAINKIKRYLNPGLEFLGCIIVKYDCYNATHQKFEKIIRKLGAEKKFHVFKTNIPNSQSVAAAAALNKTLVGYRSESPATKAFQKLALEIARKTLGSKNNKSQHRSNSLEVAVEL